MKPTTVDPVLTQVIGSYILSAAEEMGVVLIRTAYSTNIKERADCSTAIFDVEGRTVAQASHVPLHLGSLMGLVGQIVARYPLKEIKPGDMFLANDPFAGVGSQLNDLTVAAPVFAGDRVVAFVASTAHHNDVGGRFPGSEAAGNTSIFEEGLRLPLVRLVREHELQADIVRIIQTNSRIPHRVDGDLRAQIAANRIGMRRLEELLERYGADTVVHHMNAWLDYSEARIRKAIAELAPGVYSFSDYMDVGAGTDGEPRVLPLKLTVTPDSLTFDFTGAPPQFTDRSHNVVLAALMATVYYATKAALDPTIPPNAGYYRPLRVFAPKGSVINAQYPAAVSTRNHTCQKVVDVIMGAFSQVIPERVIAGCASTKLMIIGGTDPRTGVPFIDYEANSGGLGARMEKDGLDVCRAHMTNTSNLPIEALEQEDPLLVERYELVPDTGGPGRTRGGLGVRRDTRLLGDGFEHSGFAYGVRYPGNGLRGGLRGRITAPGMLVKNYGKPDQEVLDPGAHYRLRQGDVLSVFTPGGGGFGDPLDRPPELVARDVLEGKVSREQAKADYGVILADDGRVDEAATAEYRRQQREGAGRVGAAMGQ